MPFIIKANATLIALAIVSYPLLKQVPLAKVNYPLPLACFFFFVAGLILAFFAGNTPASGTPFSLGDLYMDGVSHTFSLITAVIALNFFFAVGIGLCFNSGANVTMALSVWMSMLLLAGISYDVATGNTIPILKTAVMLTGIIILIFGFNMPTSEAQAKPQEQPIQEG